MSARSIGASARTIRRVLLAGVLAGMLAVPAPSIATDAGGCLVGGSVKISPGIFYTPQFGSTVRITATLSSCTQAPNAGPTGGTLSMGNVWTDGGGLTWQEPVGVLQGGCLSAVTRGTAIARWPDGTATVMTLDVHSVFNQLFVSGAVLPGVTLTATNPQPGQASSVTVATTRFAVGSLVAGQQQVIGPEGAPIACGLGGLTEIFMLGGSTITDD